MKPICLYLPLICLLISSGCGKQGKKQEGKDPDLSRIEQWGFPIGDEYLQTYIGSFCYSTTYRHNETDYFLGYNQLLHAIDILDLTNKKPYKQILLEREGADGVLALKGVDFYKGELVIEDNAFFCRLDMNGKILSRKSKNELCDPFAGYGLMKPGLFIYLSLYSFFFFNPETGEIAIILYANEPTEKPVKIVLVSCDNWEITDTVDIVYPDFILNEGNMGVLNSVHAYPCVDKILYNFPASSQSFFSIIAVTAGIVFILSMPGI